MIEFDSYVAIDWSGARTYAGAIQLAECHPGHGAPKRMAVPLRLRRQWRRTDVLTWLRELVRGNQRILVGVDYAFAYPFCDREAYFPGYRLSPASPEELWQSVEKTCQAEPDLYAGAAYLTPKAPFAEYLCFQTYTGASFAGNRYRDTERACQRIGGTPSCVFKCVGPGSVGVGSLAGMRLLHALRCERSSRVAIWPFDDFSGRPIVVVEIFPQLYYLLAEQTPRAWTNPAMVNHVLNAFGSLPLSSEVRVTSEHEADAIVSAAALRYFASQPNAWRPSEMTECSAAQEGWIFGVV